MASVFLPLPSPATGSCAGAGAPVLGRTGGLRLPPGRVRRVAFYGPLAITYDCQDSALDGETDRDVLEVAFVPETEGGDTRRMRPADRLLVLALDALRQALHISYDELIDNAPHRLPADG